MNRAELVEAIGTKLDLSDEIVDLVIQELCDQVTSTVTRGEDVYIRDFGRWKPRRLPPARGVNPYTGLAWEVGERTSVQFVPGKALKEGRGSDDGEAQEG